MNRKRLWWMVAVSVVLNVVLLTLYLFKGNDSIREVVATIGKKEITQLEWETELEQRYGREILGEIIDQQVIEVMAEQYNIKVSDQEVDREMLLVRTMYGQTTNESMDEETWKEQIRYSLLLDELLTKDVTVKEAELQEYYEQNKSMFQIPTSYHVSHIIVKTKKEADQTIKELEQGSNFATLAMERSLDEFSASAGGDIGYISEETDNYAGEYVGAIKELKENEWSKPVELEEGFAIIMLHDQIKGQSFSYKEVKDSIRRQLALEQMDVSATARDFWEEAKVTWKFEEK